MTDVTSTAVAVSVEARCDAIAKVMIAFQRLPSGCQTRDDLVASVEELMERLHEDWFHLVMKHRLEAFEARVAGIDGKTPKEFQ